MSTASTVQMTARQFLQLGEDPPGVRLELVDGDVAASPSPRPDHAYVVFSLITILGPHIAENDLGRACPDLDTVFGEHDVRRPDLLFCQSSRLHLVGDAAMQGPPDLAVEVVSPSSSRTDCQDKYRQYEAAGVAHYWIIDPAQRTIEAFELRQGVYKPAGTGRDVEVVRLPPFPELAIPLGRLWHPTT